MTVRAANLPLHLDAKRIENAALEILFEGLTIQFSLKGQGKSIEVLGAIAKPLPWLGADGILNDVFPSRLGLRRPPPPAPRQSIHS